MDLLTGLVTAQYTADPLCEVQFRSFIYTAAGLHSSTESCTSRGQTVYAHRTQCGPHFKPLHPDHPQKTKLETLISCRQYESPCFNAHTLKHGLNLEMSGNSLAFSGRRVSMPGARSKSCATARFRAIRAPGKPLKNIYPKFSSTK